MKIKFINLIEPLCGERDSRRVTVMAARRPSRVGGLAAVALLGFAALGAGTRASAGCADALVPHGAPSHVPSVGQITAAVYRPDASTASLRPVAEAGDDDDAILGLWEFKLAGFMTDYGTQAFHVGGTETMFSAGVNPQTGDICQGAWRKVGPSTFTVSHIAMAWTAPGAEYGVLVHFHMTINVAPSGNSFTGKYSVSLYNETPADPFDESSPPFASGTGTLSATRVKPD